MKRTFYLALIAVVCLFCLSVPAQVKDSWTSVRSKNFFLIGNAPEADIRQAATRLEQFHETFRRIFPRTKVTTTLQTNVVVFKNTASYRPFKPRRSDGRIDDGIAAYFQAGEYVNYITLSADGPKSDVDKAIFHEYVHFLLDLNYGRSEIPPWFNEGLAEYYQTFRIENDQKVTLGDIQSGHLAVLQRSQLIPLKTFFEIDNHSLHERGDHSRGIFYAQAWALMHYLLQGTNGPNTNGLNKFLGLVMSDVEPEKAFLQAFQMDYEAMEKALREYVAQRSYRMSVITFPNKLVFDTGMTAAPLSEAETNAYLGDLLYHTNNVGEATAYLQKALSLDPGSSIANTSMGLVKMRERKFDEAKKYLEKATASDKQNYIAHYNYAYIISREFMDEFGYVESYPAEAAAKMRRSLQKAVELRPDFAPSYHLLGFINLVNDESLDETVGLLKKVLQLHPGRLDDAFILAQIYLKQEKFAEARELAEKVVRNSDNSALRANAQNVLDTIGQYEERKAFYEKQDRDIENKGFRIVRHTSQNPLSEDELERIREENENLNLNRVAGAPKAGEKQTVGYIEKVACVRGEVSYTIRTAGESFVLSSKDFENLRLMSLIDEATNLAFGCDAQVKNFLAVITYRPVENPRVRSRGTLTALTFVPKFFRLMTSEEMAEARQIIVVDETKPVPSAANDPVRMERERRQAMLDGIREALRKPGPGEKREIGIVEKIECAGASVFFYITTGKETLKLYAKPQSVKFMSFTPEMADMQFGCGVKVPPVRAVVTYRASEFRLTDTANGELISLEFVPGSFSLD